MKNLTAIELNRNLKKWMFCKWQQNYFSSFNNELVSENCRIFCIIIVMKLFSCWCGYSYSKYSKQFSSFVKPFFAFGEKAFYFISNPN